MVESERKVLRFGVDFDNTLADTTGVLTQLTNFKLGTSYKPSDINEWDFWEKAGIADTFWAIYDLMDKINLRKALPPVSPFAPAVVKWLMKRGHVVHVVTANKPEAMASINGWLWAHGIETQVRAMGRISPGQKAKLRYDVLIDDSPKLIEAVARAPSKRLILLNQPWNEGIDVSAHKNIFRAKDWLHVLDILRGMGA